METSLGRPNGKIKAPRRRGPIGITIKKWFVLSAAGIVALFGLLGLFGKNGILDMLHLKSIHRNLQRENLALLQKQEKLKGEMARLGDLHYVEFLARDQMGLMRPNEVFVILEPSPPHSSIDNL
jgi:cell division protein FtsB